MLVEPLRITLLTGFLGSGKTTLLKSYLESEAQSIGVIINEAGEIDIDGAFLEYVNTKLSLETVPSGCLCCTSRAEIVNVIGALLDRGMASGQKIQSIVIELSGLAVPGPIINAISSFTNWGRDITINTICVFDCLNGLCNATAYPEVGDQLAIADTVVLTKQDMARRSRIEDSKALIGTVAPFGVVVDEDDAQLRSARAFGPNSIAERGGPAPRSGGALRSEFAFDGHRHSSVCSVAFASEEAQDRDEFRWNLEQIVYQLGDDLLRMKALIRAGKGSKAVLIQTVGATFGDPAVVDMDEGVPSALVFLVRSTFDPACFVWLNEALWKRQTAQTGVSDFHATF